MTIFSYPRTIRFHETDAAGVVYFANVLIICHEAYEGSLAYTGIDLQAFFGKTPAYPIVHTSVDFHRPLRCGYEILVGLTPHQRSDTSFEIHYRITHEDQLAATALTQHVCIDAQRHRLPLPAEIIVWIRQLTPPIA